MIAAYNEASALLMTYAPSFSTMTPSSVDLRISQAEAAVNRMFAESAYFPTSFQVSLLAAQ